MTDDEIAALKAAAEAATPGTWMLETSCSWRRIGTGSGGGDVCCPIKQNDGHPDLYFRNGGHDGPDARYIIAAQPSAVLALLAERERLRRALAAAVRAHYSYMDAIQDQVAAGNMRADPLGEAIEAARAALEPGA